MSNVADQRKSSSMYERVEFWLAHFSWLYPDDFEELQALAAEVSKERERISRATIFERKE